MRLPAGLFGCLMVGAWLTQGVAGRDDRPNGLQHTDPGVSSGFSEVKLVPILPVVADADSDAGVRRIVAPTGAIDSGTAVTPQARVWNYGTVRVSLPVKFRIGAFYSDSQYVTNLNPGDSVIVNFASWTAVQKGMHTTRCTAGLAGDKVPANNARSDSVYVQVVDVGVTEVLTPRGMVDSGITLTPQARIRNFGTVRVSFPVEFRVGSIYNNFQNVTNLDPGDSIVVSFAPWTPYWRGTYEAKCTTRLTGDQQPRNDALSDSVTVWVHDVGVTAILAPVGAIDSGTVVTPQARVKNLGSSSVSFPVTLGIGTFYRDSQNVTSLNPGDSTTVSFTSWTAVRRGTHTTRCSTALTRDYNPANDTLTGSVTVRVPDVGVTQILVPVGVVDSGTLVTPRARVKNFGNVQGPTPITLRIGAFYTDTRTFGVPAPGDSVDVSFTSCFLRSRGMHAVECSTQLSGDMIPGNDKRTDSVLVAVQDVGADYVIAPVDTVDSAAVVTPQVQVRNYGNLPVSFPVRFKIGTTYNETTWVTGLLPGDSAVASLPQVAMNFPRGLGAEKCSTELVTDGQRLNDKAYGTFWIRPWTHDVGVARILAPVGAVDSGVAVWPQARVRNYGAAPESNVPVRFRIGTWSNTKYVPTLAGGDSADVVFDSLALNLPRGYNALKCSTALAGDGNRGNNALRDSVQLQVRDVGVRQIVAPAVAVDSGTVVTPEVLVRNSGTLSASFDVKFDIADGYADSVSISDLAAGRDTTVRFASWSPIQLGTYAVRCSTRLSGDIQNRNDRATGSVKVQVPDVGATAIVAPAGATDTLAKTPRATVRNFGEVAETFQVWFTILAPDSSLAYLDSVLAANLAPNATATLSFPVWAGHHDLGRYSAMCYTAKPGDGNPANDTVRSTFTISLSTLPAGWSRRADFLPGPKGKAVKDGGCLAYFEQGDTGSIYALKGNNTVEFYQHLVMSNTWVALETIPRLGTSGKKKAVKKGAALTAVGDKIYAIKGNNTVEFWQYQPSVRTWRQMRDVPFGVKACKEGSGLAAIRKGDSTFLYLLKGSGTTEFYRFNLASEVWETMTSAPGGASGKGFKNGSCIAWDGADTVYALKGSYNEFFAYDIATNAWVVRMALPLTGNSGKKKKVKDGAGIASMGGLVYGLKGGNTLEFWTYSPVSGNWTQKEDMPLGGGKRVKGGGATVHAPSMAALYALKGNNTPEFWVYNPIVDCPQLKADLPRENASGATPLPGTFSLRAGPNPFSDWYKVNYQLAQPGHVRLTVHDLSGRQVATLVDGRQDAGNYSFTWPRTAQDGEQVVPGVYFVRLDSPNCRATRKVVLGR